MSSPFQKDILLWLSVRKLLRVVSVCFHLCLALFYFSNIYKFGRISLVNGFFPEWGKVNYDWDHVWDITWNRQSFLLKRALRMPSSNWKETFTFSYAKCAGVLTLVNHPFHLLYGCEDIESIHLLIMQKVFHKIWKRESISQAAPHNKTRRGSMHTELNRNLPRSSALDLRF